ncbi:MAG: hypothetical protein LBO74_12660, partial [Candidatus Symbiothrix sp.]|nr:hypothetical protein [Candidatus Symbiothrix sp.]
ETAQTNELIEEDMAEYVKSVTEYDDVKRAMAYHLKEGMAKGEKRGERRGEKKGIRKGMERGIKMGICEIARTGLKEGISLEMISKLTGLTTEEILKIK